MKHLESLSPKIELCYEKMLTICLDYLFKISEDKMELLYRKLKDKAVKLSDDEEKDHSNIQLVELYLKDNFDNKDSITKDEAVIILSHDKLNSFKAQYLHKHMDKIDYLNIYKAHSIHKMNFNKIDIKVDKALRKQLTEDVLKEYKNHLPWDEDELQHFDDESIKGKFKNWAETDM